MPDLSSIPTTWFGLLATVTLLSIGGISWLAKIFVPKWLERMAKHNEHIEAKTDECKANAEIARATCKHLPELVRQAAHQSNLFEHALFRIEAGRTKTLLLAEDNETDQLILERQIDEVINGQYAKVLPVTNLNQVTKLWHDAYAVLADINLPDANWPTWLNFFNQQPKKRIAFISGAITDDQRKTATELNIPIVEKHNKEELLNVVLELLK